MKIYKYKILKDSGKIIKGEIQGYSKEDAISRLLMEKHTILNINRKFINYLDKPIYQSYTNRIERLLLILNQLQVMTSSGLPLMESIKSMEEHTDDRILKKILKSIHSNLYYGNSLKNSLDPLVFPSFFIHIIGIGESSGNLVESLNSLSLYYSKDLEFYHKIKSLLYYPAILLVLSIITLFVTTNFIVPNFIVFLEDGLSSLPWYSRIIITISSFIQEVWHILFTMILVFGFLIYKKTHWYINKKLISLIALKTPIISKLLIKRTLLKFMKNLEVIINSGSTLSYGLDFLSENHNNPLFQRSLRNIQGEILKGSKFSEALKTENVYFSTLIINMINAGERSGNLVFVLGKITEYLQEDLDQKTKKFIALLEPSLIVFMAVVVGGILVSVMMPIFSSYEFML